MFPAQLAQGHEVAIAKVFQAAADGIEGGIVREDLGGFLESLVLGNRDEHGCRAAVSGDRDMFTPVGHLVEKFGELAAELAYRDGLGHGSSVHVRVHHLEEDAKGGEPRVS